MLYGTLLYTVIHLGGADLFFSCVYISCLSLHILHEKLTHISGTKQTKDSTVKQGPTSLRQSVTPSFPNHQQNPVDQKISEWSSSVPANNLSNLDTSPPIDRYRAGFNACAHEIQYFLTRTPGVDAEARMRILEHLANHVQNLFWIKFNGNQNTGNSGLMRALKLKQVLTERHEQDILKNKGKGYQKAEPFYGQRKSSTPRSLVKASQTSSNSKTNRVTHFASGFSKGKVDKTIQLHRVHSNRSDMVGIPNDNNQKQMVAPDSGAKDIQMVQYQEGSENVWRPW